MKRFLPMTQVLGAFAVALYAVGLFGHAPEVSGDAKQNPPPAEPAQPFQAVGRVGCASAACHGGPAVDSLTGKFDSRTWSGAATHWFARDPHTKAYADLESPLAKSIMERLHSSAKATDDVRCLACHTNPALANLNERALQQEGVSCEACHGNASGWLHDHTSAAGRKAGMAKMSDLGERALACAGCHVGAPADTARSYPVRDMNHDMIAAGHPRLNFDFADYQGRLTPHWYEQDRDPSFEVKSWLVGRAAHAEATGLLRVDREVRAKNDDARTPSPEFSEWSCASCHHKLDTPFARTAGTPAQQSLWPMDEPKLPIPAALRARRIRMASATNADSVQALESILSGIELESLDRDRASQVFHGLSARERMRMARDARTTFDPAFEHLAQSLTLARGNLDFTLKPEAKSALKELLGRAK